MTLAEFKATMRLARRGARRQWKRTLLVAILIAVPVAAAMVGAAMSRAGKLTPEEAATFDFGAADIRIETFAAPPELDALVDKLIAQADPDAVVERHRALYGPIAAGTGGSISDLDPTGPLAATQWALIEGRASSSADEVVITNTLADRLNVVAGDSVDLRLDGTTERPYQVAGVVRHRVLFDATAVFMAPVGIDRLIAEQDPSGWDQPRTTWLVQSSEPWALADAVRSSSPELLAAFYPPPPVPERPASLAIVPDDIYYSLSAEQVRELAAMQVTEFEIEMAAYEMVAERPGGAMQVLPQLWSETKAERIGGYFEDNGAFERPEIIGTLVATLLLAEVALVAGAAYATGTRRRLREIGLLGSNGATPEHIRAVVLGEGFVGGAIGALGGFALAVTAILLGRPVMQRFVSKVIDDFPLQPLDVIGPVVAGVLAATVAAWIPSRTASQVPTVTALQGRMPVKEPSRWVPLAGLAMAGLGAFLLVVAKTATSSGDAGTTQAAIGVILMVVGATLLTGPIVAFIGRFAHRLPATLRLVIRDSARQRTRAAAAISALLVVMIGPVLIGIGLESSEASSRIHGLPYPGNHVAVIGDHTTPDTTGSVTEDHMAQLKTLLPDAEYATYRTSEAEVLFAAEFAAVQTPPENVVGSDAFQYTVSDRHYEPGRAAIANDDLVALLGDDRIASNLAAGRPVVLGVAERPTQIQIDGVVRDAVELPVPVTWGTSRLLITQAMADEWGLTATGTRALFVLPDAITPEITAELWDTNLIIAVGDASLIGTRNLLLIALGATLLVVLGIVALVMALTATESDSDLRTIVAVGAKPSLRRRFLATSTVYYTVVAAALAVPLAWLLMKAAAPTGQWVEVGPFGTVPSGLVRIPWLAIGGVGVVIPFVAGLAVLALARSLPSALPRRLT